GHGADDVGSAEGDGVEEAQGTDGLVEGAPGDPPLLHQVQLVGPDVLGAEVLGGAAAVTGEAGDGLGVGLDGPGRLVAELPILDQALAERGHGELPLQGRRGPPRWRPSGREACARPRKSARPKTEALTTPDRAK